MGNRQGGRRREPAEETAELGHPGQLQCPRCGSRQPIGTTRQEFIRHVSECIEGRIVNPLINQMLAGQKPNSVPKIVSPDFRYVKVPTDSSKTKFQWTRVPNPELDIGAIGPLDCKDAQKLSFLEKQAWLRYNLEKRRISWHKGADYMKLERSNILMTSLVASRKVNMYKEVKVEFYGDEKVNDAGGLLREWVHMVTKQMLDSETGIFEPSNCADITYRLKSDDDLDQEFSGQLLELFGKIIGKSLFERIPIVCYLDRTILSQLSGHRVRIQDIYGYDEELYKNWTRILQCQEVEDLCLTFTMVRNQGETIQEIELIENGANIGVDRSNRFRYIDCMVEMLTEKKVARSIDRIRKGLYQVVPASLLGVFETYELEMLLYGVPFIDLQNWRDNTVYQLPYSANHQIIQWFWQAMAQFDQEQLGRVLHFCTGSSRTPIGGFSKLESNRGNYAKFQIVSCPFVDYNGFPKGHTCFNRLELPLYPSFASLQKHLAVIGRNNLDGVFGLD